MPRERRTPCLLVVPLVAIAMSLSAPAQEIPAVEPPPHVKGEQLLLADCTAQCAAEFPRFQELVGFNPYPRKAVPLQPSDIDPAIRKQLIDVASRWALATCYLPCPIEMCACLLVDPSGTYGAYIGPAKREPEISPEAVVFLDPETFQLAGAIRFHSPCLGYAKTIDWTRDTCRQGSED